MLLALNMSVFPGMWDWGLCAVLDTGERPGSGEENIQGCSKSTVILITVSLFYISETWACETLKWSKKLGEEIVVEFS